MQRPFQAVGIQQWTPHDLRRTGRTGLAALGVEDNIAERVINHKQERSKRVYNLYPYFKEKQTALNRWAAHLSKLLNEAEAEHKRNQAAGGLAAPRSVQNSNVCGG